MPGIRDIAKLHSAIQGNDLNAILALFEQEDFDVNTQGRSNWTPLLVAVEENKPDLVKLFLCMGANPNHAECNGITPLMLAVNKGLEEVVSVLLNDYRTKVVLPKSFMHCTVSSLPLHSAAAGGHSSIVKLLLDAGINPHTLLEGEPKKSASALAAENGHEELARLLPSQEVGSLEELIIKKIRTEPPFKHLSKPDALASAGLFSCAGTFPEYLESKVQDTYGVQDFPLTGYLDGQAFNACLYTEPTDDLVDNSAKLLGLLESGLVYHDNYLGYGTSMMSSTPVFDAAKHGLEGIVRILLACGTEITQKGVSDNTTPAEVARSEGHLSIAFLLEEAKQTQIDIFKEYKAACDAGRPFDFSSYKDGSTADSAASNDSGGAAGAAAVGQLRL